MTEPTREQHSALWNAWDAYQLAERGCFTAYLQAIRLAEFSHDERMAAARAADQQAWTDALAQYRKTVSAWFEHAAWSTQAAMFHDSAALETAWAGFLESRSRAVTDRATAEREARSAYRRATASAQTQYQLALAQARDTWRAASEPAIALPERSGDGD